MGLAKERQTVIKTILHLGQFPMGPEFLKATNSTQFDGAPGGQVPLTKCEQKFE